MSKRKSPPQKNSKQKATFWIIIICFVAVLGTKWLLHLQRQAGLNGLNKLPARSAGNPQAALHIIEYIDFQCPACAEGSKMLKEYLKNHGDKIFLELKYYPLPMHAHGMSSSRYAECASRQGNFWGFADLILERQPQWITLIDVKPTFDGIAREIGLDQAALQTCLQSQDPDHVINADKTKGTALGIKSTPTYFIDNKMFVGMKSLKDVLNARLQTTQPQTAVK